MLYNDQQIKDLKQSSPDGLEAVPDIAIFRGN